MAQRMFRLVSRGGFSVLALLMLGIAACGSSSTPVPGSHASDLAIKLNTTSAATLKQVQLRASIICGPWLILTPHAATYSQSELAAIANFAKQYVPGPGASPFPDGTTTYTGYTVDSPTALPPTLAYVPGGDGCDGLFEVTNTGNSLVQVNSLSFQLIQPAAAFHYDFHVLDTCPYMHGCVCEGCGALFPCSYRADFHLTLTQTLIAGNLRSAGYGCSLPLTLAPGATTPIVASFERPSNAGGYWLRGVPVLSVTSAQGTSTLTYSSLPNNLNFVDIVAHQAQRYTDPNGLVFSEVSAFPGTCYTQKGNAFVPITTFATTADASNPLGIYSPYCV